MTVTKESVLTAIHPVEDPELKISLVELGLVYDVRIEEGEEGVHAEVDLTLTSPGCPVAPEIMASVHRAALTTEGVDTVHVNLVWTPRWEPKIHASEDALMDMGIF
ncbi:MAG TPA: metal-sulfur cluster assembly factor [Candidatus Thalassarchaeaceae archaeon]|jgi:metal-sulfur cluster biosynthetic enzyme|nr:metal-sulfur cluster assembly factor [Candidatus Thalassarchaeaceae archaeon]HJM18849.1 metal-sulfur cluster assembly factor [Candidatus Thalassarchaeaceae archaeon]